MAERSEQRRRAGVCIQCGKPSVRKGKCADHVAAYVTRRRLLDAIQQAWDSSPQPPTCDRLCERILAAIFSMVDQAHSEEKPG